jgi:hypothetical protein
LGLGLGLGVQAAHALWYDPVELPEATIRLGVVGFAVTRDLGDGNVPLTDGGDPTELNYSTDPDNNYGGSSLTGQLTTGDAEALQDQDQDGALYVKYVVDGRADGDAELTYLPELRLPAESTEEGATVGTEAVLYYAGTEPGLSCEAFFKVPANLEDQPYVSHNPDADPALSANLDELAAIVADTSTTGTHVWCLMIKKPEASHTDTASISVGTAVGEKSDEAVWTAVIDRSTKPEDQLIVAFTPTVSREE